MAGRTGYRSVTRSGQVDEVFSLKKELINTPTNQGAFGRLLQTTSVTRVSLCRKNYRNRVFCLKSPTDSSRLMKKTFLILHGY